MKKGDEIKSYRDLLVYQKSYKLCLEIYECTLSYPKHEIYGIVSQMRRAAVSIPSNIAEGHKRRKKKEYAQFLNIALGSLAELETQISLSADIGYLKREKADNLLKTAESCNQLLCKLIGVIENL